MKGIFISFEGIDGCGKSTQINLLAKHFAKQKRSFVKTEEPGGTEARQARGMNDGYRTIVPSFASRRSEELCC